MGAASSPPMNLSQGIARASRLKGGRRQTDLGLADVKLLSDLEALYVLYIYIYIYICCVFKNAVSVYMCFVQSVYLCAACEAD